MKGPFCFEWEGQAGLKLAVKPSTTPDHLASALYDHSSHLADITEHDPVPDPTDLEPGHAETQHAAPSQGFWASDDAPISPASSKTRELLLAAEEHTNNILGQSSLETRPDALITLERLILRGQQLLSSLPQLDADHLIALLARAQESDDDDADDNDVDSDLAQAVREVGVPGSFRPRPRWWIMCEA